MVAVSSIISTPPPFIPSINLCLHVMPLILSLSDSELAAAFIHQSDDFTVSSWRGITWAAGDVEGRDEGVTGHQAGITPATLHTHTYAHTPVCFFSSFSEWKVRQNKQGCPQQSGIDEQMQFKLLSEQTRRNTQKQQKAGAERKERWKEGSVLDTAGRKRSTSVEK